MSDGNNWEVLRGKRVLLCEDHPINVQIVCSLLEKQGVSVLVTENGQEGACAFANSREGEFAAVLMDINMPVMNGFEAAKAIRALDRADGKTVPVIAMSADDSESDKQLALDAGMNAHLPKPVDARKLYDTLAQLFR